MQMHELLDLQVERITNSVVDRLQGESLAMPVRLTTKQLANHLGCCTATVRRHWSEWRLTYLGRTRHGEMVFCGPSVQRHINRISQKGGV